MREGKDSALSRNRVPRGECIRIGAAGWRERGGGGRARTRDRLARARVPEIRSGSLAEGVSGGEQSQGGKNLSNKYREERTHECRQKSPNDQLRLEVLRRARLFPEIPADF